MEEDLLNKDENPNKAVGLSVILLIVNTVLATISFGGAFKYDPDNIATLFAFCISFTALLAVFALGYNQKKYRWVKWVFAICLVGTLILLGLGWYAVQLGKGFKN